MAKDCQGKEVKVGSIVKVLSIDPKVWEWLPSEEVEDLKSMIGDKLNVYKVTEQFTNVEKVWDAGNGRSRSHSISLSSEEIKLIKY